MKIPMIEPRVSREIATDEQRKAADDIKAAVQALNDKMWKGADLGVSTSLAMREGVVSMAGGSFDKLSVSVALHANL
jgi:hypothetical protein